MKWSEAIVFPVYDLWVDDKLKGLPEFVVLEYVVITCLSLATVSVTHTERWCKQ